MASDEKIKIVDLDDSVSVRKRMEPRCYPILNVPVHDMDDPAIEGYVQDLSGHGVQISGINATAGQKKTFFIELHQLGEVRPFSFEAECRWVHSEDRNVPALAGFEIISITDKDFTELKKIIESFTLSDPHDMA